MYGINKPSSLSLRLRVSTHKVHSNKTEQVSWHETQKLHDQLLTNSNEPEIWCRCSEAATNEPWGGVRWFRSSKNTRDWNSPLGSNWTKKSCCRECPVTFWNLNFQRIKNEKFPSIQITAICDCQVNLFLVFLIELFRKAKIKTEKRLIDTESPRKWCLMSCESTYNDKEEFLAALNQFLRFLLHRLFSLELFTCSLRQKISKLQHFWARTVDRFHHEI